MARFTKPIAFIASLSVALAGGCGTVLFIRHYAYAHAGQPEAVSAWLKEFEAVIRDVIFIVPLISAITVALFNNVFKLYDKVEQVRNSYATKGMPFDEEKFQAFIKRIDGLSREIVRNARYAILSSIVTYFLLLIRRSIGGWSIFSMPISYLLEGAIATIVLTIPSVLIDQFAVLPGFVEMYRILVLASVRTVDPPKQKSELEPHSVNRRLTDGPEAAK